MSFAPRPAFAWKLRTRSLALGERTLVMGILNVTPDSFSDGGHFYDETSAPERATVHALEMLRQGADILDIGGESTRPNATPISPDEEQQRVLPVIEAILREQPETVISIDTFHASTARAAVHAGVEIVNDVSGMMWDPAMATTCAELLCGVVLMHARDKPQQWGALPPLSPEEILPVVEMGLRESVAIATNAGLEREHIVLDPGVGFGKKGDENYTLLARLEELKKFNLPLLVGLSRKGFLGKTLSKTPLHNGTPPDAKLRLNASIAGNVAAVLAGTHIVRVHDVQATSEACAITDAILRC
jgi:dihydropteroate synthase